LNFAEQRRVGFGLLRMIIHSDFAVEAVGWPLVLQRRWVKAKWREYETSR
jgi:hypothetical protein